jgi:uncharacterized protein involved in outer membrane biogenesis
VNQRTKDQSTIPEDSPKTTSSRGHTRFLKLSYLFVTIGLLVILFLIALPYGIRYGIIRGLTLPEVKKVLLRDVDFNPFTGQLILHDLKIERTKDVPLTLPEGRITLGWQSLFHREIHIEEVTLRDTELLLQQKKDGQIVVGGITAGTEGKEQKEAEGKPWSFTLDRLDLFRDRFLVQTPQATVVLQVKEGRLSELSNHTPEKAAHLILKGDLNNSPLEFHATLLPFLAHPVYSGKAVLKAFDITALNPFLPDKWETDGQVTVDLDFKAEPSASPLYILRGNATVKKLRLIDRSRKLSLLASQSLQVEGIDISGAEEATLGEIRGEGLKIADTGDKGEPPLTEIDRMVLRTASYHAPGSFRLDSATLEGLRVTLHRNRKGAFQSIEDLIPPKQAKPSEEKASEGVVDIGRIGISNGRVTFQDDSVSPSYHTELHINAFDLSNIQSEKADQPSPLSLDGKIGKYTHLKVQGNLYPFAGKTTFNLKGTLKGLDLPPLSSYTGESLGYNLVSGQLTSDFAVKVAAGKINGKGELSLNNLEVSPQDTEKMKELAAQLTMPLDAALAMLRDKNQNIRLTLPVSGNINDPKFDISDAVNQALGKALKTTAVSFLKYTLQPYGAILTVAQLAGKAVTAVRLDPVVFPPGSSELNPGTEPYLDRVATLMKERPEIRIKLCGKATPADRITEEEKGAEGTPPADKDIDAALLELARKRSSVIKDFLVSRKQIKPERLFICNPEIDTDEKASSRVELLI